MPHATFGPTSASRPPRRLLRLTVAAAAAALAGCGGDGTGPDAGGDRTYVRVVNSAFQATAAATTANSFGCPCTPLSIDVLYDSATTAPSLVGMAPNSIGGGSAGPAPANGNAFYGELTPGVRSFVARATGGANPTFFTTPSRTAYLPKQLLPGRIYHTFLIVGVNPVQPASGPPVFATSTAFANGPEAFPLFVDDPFAPPTVQGPSGPTVQARVRIINAAPFSASFTGVYITPGATPPSPATLAITVSSVIPAPRVAAPYLNAAPGEYTITFRDLFTGTVYVQAPLTLLGGEVRTLVLQNTLPPGLSAIPAGGVPAATAAQYYKLTNILDNKF